MKLQKNYTTPEQSKRLLKAGVPMKSADCYYAAIGLEPEKYGYSDFPYFITTNTADMAYLGDPNIPCWTLGRLIDIVLTDADIISVLGRKNVNTQMEQVIKLLESGIINLTNLKKIV